MNLWKLKRKESLIVRDTGLSERSIRGIAATLNKYTPRKFAVNKVRETGSIIVRRIK